MAHKDFQEYIEEEKPEKFLLMYHWDTDGIACAALFLDYIKEVSPDTEVVLMHPTINNYFLTEREFTHVDALDVDGMLTTDINYPLDVIERLERLVPNVFVFDHHSQTANIDRPGMQDTEYPGCSMMVNDYLMKPLSLTAVLGMVGDQEDRIKERTDFFPQIEEMMKEHDLSFDDVQQITKLLDTMYIVGESEGLEYAIELLRKDPKAALTDERLLANEKRIHEEYSRECAKEMKDLGTGMLYMRIESDLSLISEVTRAKAKEHPDNIIITDQSWGELASFYVRRRNAPIDLGIVVDAAREKGYNAGGKPEVAGVVIPTADLDTFRSEVEALIKGLIPS